MSAAVLYYSGQGASGEIKPNKCTLFNAQRDSSYDCHGWALIMEEQTVSFRSQRVSSTSFVVANQHDSQLLKALKSESPESSARNS